MRFIPALIFILSSSLSWAKEDPPDKLYFGVNSNYTLPLIEVKNPLHKPEVESGLLKDLGDAIAGEMKLKPIWILLPKNRVAPSLLSGDIDLICHLHEIWQSQIKKDVWWTQELYQSVNVVVYLGKKSIANLKDLNGERVGTVVNFIYHDLEPEFTTKRITREDGTNNQSNIQKLIHGRLDYIVMSNFEYDYFSRIYPELKESELRMDGVRTKCALSKKSKFTLEQVNHAIDAIKKSGAYSKILKTYTDDR